MSTFAKGLAMVTGASSGIGAIHAGCPPEAYSQSFSEAVRYRVAEAA